MITSKNYFDEVPKILDKLPAATKEAHQLVISMKNDGISDPFNTGDTDINNMGELLLEEVNKIIAEDSLVKNKSVKVQKVEDKKSTKFENKVMQKPKKSRIKVAKKKSKPEPKTVIINKESTSVSETANAKKKSPATRAVEAKVRNKKVSTSKTKKVTKKSAVKTKIVKVNPPKAPVNVKKLSLELQTIKNFIGMNGKDFTLHGLEAKVKQLQKHFDKKEINDYKKVIETILSKFKKAVHIFKPESEFLQITIEPKFLTQCRDIIANATVMIRTEFLAGVKEKKLTLERLQEFWGNAYGEDFKKEYSGIYNKIKKIKNITLKHFSLLWKKVYSEDFKKEYSGVYNLLKEASPKKAKRMR